MDCSTPDFCPPLSPRVCSNSCPLSQWHHPTISSSVIPFSSCLHSLPASGSFPPSRLFASGGLGLDFPFSGVIHLGSRPLVTIKNWWPGDWWHFSFPPDTSSFLSESPLSFRNDRTKLLLNKVNKMNKPIANSCLPNLDCQPPAAAMVGPVAGGRDWVTIHKQRELELPWLLGMDSWEGFCFHPAFAEKSWKQCDCFSEIQKYTIFLNGHRANIFSKGWFFFCRKIRLGDFFFSLQTCTRQKMSLLSAEWWWWRWWWGCIWMVKTGWTCSFPFVPECGHMELLFLVFSPESIIPVLLPVSDGCVVTIFLLQRWPSNVKSDCLIGGCFPVLGVHPLAVLSLACCLSFLCSHLISGIHSGWCVRTHRIKPVVDYKKSCLIKVLFTWDQMASIICEFFPSLNWQDWLVLTLGRHRYREKLQKLQRSPQVISSIPMPLNATSMLTVPNLHLRKASSQSSRLLSSCWFDLSRWGLHKHLKPTVSLTELLTFLLTHFFSTLPPQ